MSTSGSINFNLTRNEIITEALELIGAIGIGESPSAEDIDSCARSLNMLMKMWQAKGMHLWTTSVMSLSLVAGQATYTLSPRPLHVKSARHRSDDTAYVDRPVYVDPRSSFEQIANKTTQGSQISRIFYDPQLTTGNLQIWPVPEASTDTLQITYLRSIEDVDASTDNVDFPQEWLEPITYNLAIRIAPKYGKVLSKSNPDIISIAVSSLQDMELWDTDSGKVRVVPAGDDSA